MRITRVNRWLIFATLTVCNNTIYNNNTENLLFKNKYYTRYVVIILGFFYESPIENIHPSLIKQLFFVINLINKSF